MTDEKLQHPTLELKVLLSIAWKASIIATEQWLAREGYDLTSLQAGLLRTLSHEGSSTISELSKRFSIDPSTLVPTVDAVERKGFLVRQRDPNDRRRVLLSLTDEGKTLATRLPHIVDDDPLLIGLSVLGEGDMKQLLNLLFQLVSAMPEGDNWLKHAHSRLLACGLKEENFICKQFIPRHP
ncbi:MAG: MarR family transcriptional regulator [Anaerolineae bacterium]|nr:MarR family transcriptional regulator [Anaerolineae bacterium]